MAVLLRTYEGYEISDDRARLDLDTVCGFLATAYWSSHREREVVERAIANSWPMGLYAPDGAQVGFARAVTDRAAFAYLADVFVLPAHRGRGLAKLVVTALMDLPELAEVERWLLATADAHSVYAALGYTALPDPELFMVRARQTYSRTLPPGR
jgi:GNAT superfamily N-acetyltransferase